MRQFKKTLLSVAAATIGLSASYASAAFVPWSNPSGNIAGLFSWSNGGSDNGLFGSPIIAGNSFTFFPSNFKAASSNGVASPSVSDRLSFTLDVAPENVAFQGITVTELGDYSITNGGSVSADAFLFVTNLDIPVAPPTNPQLGSGSFDRNLLAPPGNESGQWTIQIVKNLPNGWKRIQIVLDNVLQATSAQGGVAQIEKKVGGIIITVPEPGTIGLAIAGLGAMVIRRRK